MKFRAGDTAKVVLSLIKDEAWAPLAPQRIGTVCVLGIQKQEESKASLAYTASLRLNWAT